MAGRPSAGRAELERALRAGMSNPDAAKEAGMSVSSAEAVRRQLLAAGEDVPSPVGRGFQPGNDRWRLRSAQTKRT